MNTLHIVFRVGDSEYALGADDVLQMESYVGVTHVPGTESHVIGIVQLRGRVVPVIDLRVRFGAPLTPPTLDTRIVVAEIEDRTVGLRVDCAREVVQLDASKLQATPRVLADRAQGFVKGVAQLGKRLLMLLDLGRVVGEEQLHGEQLGWIDDGGRTGRRALPGAGS